MLTTISLPAPIVDRLQRLAVRQNRSVPATLEQLLLQQEPLPTLPVEIEQELLALRFLTDDLLLTLFHRPMLTEQYTELADLNYRAQTADGLTPSEQKRQTELGELYQRAVLRRAKCLQLLLQRGYSQGQLLSPSS